MLLSIRIYWTIVSCRLLLRYRPSVQFINFLDAKKDVPVARVETNANQLVDVKMEEFVMKTPSFVNARQDGLEMCVLIDVSQGVMD